MDLWTWITTTTSVEGIVGAAGGVTLAVLFATDRIKTRGQANRELAARDTAHAKLEEALRAQHAALVAALAAAHVDQLAARDDRIVELKQSLAKTDEARTVERDRADRATAMLGEAVEVVRVSNHLLESLGEAAKDGTT